MSPADWLCRPAEITTPSFRLVKPPTHRIHNNNTHRLQTHTHIHTTTQHASTPQNALAASSTLAPPHTSSRDLLSTPVKSPTTTTTALLADSSVAASTSPASVPLTSSRGRVIKLKLRADDDGGNSWSAASPTPSPTEHSTNISYPTNTQTNAPTHTDTPMTPAKRKAESNSIDTRPTSYLAAEVGVKVEPPHDADPHHQQQQQSQDEFEDLSDFSMFLRHSRALHQLKREYVLNTLKRHKLKRSVSTPRTPGLQATPKTPRVSHARGAMKLMRENSLNALHAGAASPSCMSPMQSPSSGAKESQQSMDWSTAGAASPTNQSSNVSQPCMSRQSSLEPFSLTTLGRTPSIMEEDATATQPIGEAESKQLDTTIQPPPPPPPLQHQSSVGSTLTLHPSPKEEEKGDPCGSPTSDSQSILDPNMFDVLSTVQPLPTPWSLQSAGVDPTSIFYLKGWQANPAITPASFAVPKYNYDPTTRPWKLPKKYILCLTPPLDQHARQLASLHTANPSANIITLPAAAFFKGDNATAPAETHTKKEKEKEKEKDKEKDKEVDDSTPVAVVGKKKKSASSTSGPASGAASSKSSNSSRPAPTAAKTPSSSRAHAALDAELQEKQKLLAYLQVRCQYLRVIEAQGGTPNATPSTANTPTSTDNTMPTNKADGKTSPTGHATTITPATTATTANATTTATTKSEKKHHTRVKKEAANAGGGGATVPASGSSSTSAPRTPRSQAGTPRNAPSTAASPVNAPATATVVKSESVRADTPPNATNTGNNTNSGSNSSSTSNLLPPSTSSGTSSTLTGTSLSSTSTTPNLTLPPLSTFAPLGGLPLLNSNTNLATNPAALMLGLGTSGTNSNTVSAPLTSPLPDLSSLFGLGGLGLPFNYDASQLSQLAGMDVPTMVMMAQAQFQLSLMNPALMGLSGLMFPFAPPTNPLTGTNPLSLLTNTSPNNDVSALAGLAGFNIGTNSIMSNSTAKST